MSCSSYIFYYIIFSSVCPMEDVSANKLRNRIRLKTLGFFGNARIRVDCATLFASLMLMYICARPWLLDHLLLVLVLGFFSHKSSASFNTWFWLNELLPPHNFLSTILTLFKCCPEVRIILLPMDISVVLIAEVSQIIIGAHSKHLFQLRGCYQPHFIDVKLS